MTTEHLPVTLSDKTPGTALAVIAPKPTVSAEEIAWAKRQALGVFGDEKLLEVLFGAFGGGIPALFIPLAIATHGAAIPVMIALGSLGTTGGIALWVTRTIRKGHSILDQSSADAWRQANHAKKCVERALRDAIERGVVLKPYTELPVQVDTDVWKVLRIEGLTPRNIVYDREGRFSYSSISVRAEMHDAERGADGTLVRKARTVYLCGGGVPHEVCSIYGQITLKAPVALMPTGSALLPAPAPEAEVAPKDILAPPPREVAPAFAPVRPAPRPSDDAGAAP